jgi:oligopeptidase A
MQASATNPLLSIRPDPAFADVRSEHVAPAVAEARVAMDHVRTELLAARGVEAFRIFDTMTEKLDFVSGIGSHLEAMGDDAFREAWSSAQPTISRAYSELFVDSALYTHLRDQFEWTQTPDKALWTRYATVVLAEFERNGAGLDQAGKSRLVQLDVELTELTLKIAQNAVDATRAFELILPTLSGLEGMPSSALEAARASAVAKGVEGYRFTLASPSYLAFMSHAPDRDLRKKMYSAYNSRGTSAPFDNTSLLAKVVDLRAERAALLGYPSFAALTLSNRMAKSYANVRTFIDGLRTKLTPAFRQEHEALKAFASRVEGKPVELMPWDLPYYAEKQRKMLYDFDDEEMRPYFVLPTVLAGMFEIVEKLFGVRVEREEQKAMSWHPDVQFYRIVEGGTVIGSFALDLFPREGKRDGAWMHGIVDKQVRPGMERAMAVIEANMSEPQNGVARLTHREVQTLFHEFGHLLHHMLSRVSVRGLSGTKVAWDFVELPSQIMENWCWEADGLAFIAKHELDGSALPIELLSKMQQARNFRSATALMRQLSFADVDIRLHADYKNDRDGTVLDFARRVMQEYAAVPLPSDFAMLASFLHLFSSPVGYASGYYSYQWAEVLDADAFDRFRKEGVLNETVGRQFREAILEKGDSLAPEELYRAFRGRDASDAALLDRLGLNNQAPSRNEAEPRQILHGSSAAVRTVSPVVESARSARPNRN